MRLSRKRYSLFFEQLAILLEAGIALGPALGAIHRESTGRYAAWVSKVLEGVLSGESFHLSLKRAGYSNIAILKVLEVVEASSHLALGLKRIAFLEKRKEVFCKRVQAILAYPIFVFFVALLILYFISSYILPQLVVLMGGETAIFTTVKAVLWTLFFFVTLIFGLGVGSYFSKKLQKRILAFLNRMTWPILKKLWFSTTTAQWAYFFKTFIDAKIPFMESLSLSLKLLEGGPLVPNFSGLADRVKEGERLSHVLASTRTMPSSATLLLSMGEEAGNLPLVLDKIFEMQEQASENFLQKCLSLLGPISILLLSLLVAFLAITLFTPLTSFDFN